MAAALKGNATLSKIEFEDNIIGDEGARELAMVLAENLTITLLDLKDNDNIDPKIIKLFQTIFATNETLKKHKEKYKNVALEYYVEDSTTAPFSSATIIYIRRQIWLSMTYGLIMDARPIIMFASNKSEHRPIIMFASNKLGLMFELISLMRPLLLLYA